MTKWWSLNPYFNDECSRKRFSEKQAEQWWAENRARVYEQYNVHMIDKSSVGVGSEDLAHWHMKIIICKWNDIFHKYSLTYWEVILID